MSDLGPRVNWPQLLTGREIVRLHRAAEEVRETGGNTETSYVRDMEHLPMTEDERQRQTERLWAARERAA